MNTYPEDFETYTARDGAQLPYRFFEGPSDVVLIFLHGITEPSLYLREFGKYVSQLGLATVYLPDLRGYGNHPIRRGDIDYIGQLDDDLEDLFCFVQKRIPLRGSLSEVILREVQPHSDKQYDRFIRIFLPIYSFHQHLAPMRHLIEKVDQVTSPR